MTKNAPPVAIESVGENPTPIWGLSNRERTRRIAAASGLGADGATRVIAHDAYAWDPAWLRHIAENPGLVLTMGHVPALGHARVQPGAGEALVEHPPLELLALCVVDPVGDERRAPIGAGRTVVEVLGLGQGHRIGERPGLDPPAPCLFGGARPWVSRLATLPRSRSHKIHSMRRLEPPLSLGPLFHEFSSASWGTTSEPGVKVQAEASGSPQAQEEESPE